MSTAPTERYQSFAEFYPYYLQEHSNDICRRLHYVGSLLVLGIYLPMLVVEPLLTYRFGRVQETMKKAVSKGIRITIGYGLLLLLLGCVREWLSAGTVFGHVLSRPVLPMASMPAGGFIVLGVLCAVWRTLAKKHKN